MTILQRATHGAASRFARLSALGLLALALVLALAPLTAPAHADGGNAAIDLGQVDETRDSSLTLELHRANGEAIEGVHASAYRVAEAKRGLPAAPGYAALLERTAWADTVGTGDLTQGTWATLARTLADYVTTSGKSADAAGATDQAGTFRAEHLKPGVYLVVLNDRVRETARGIETLSFTPAIVSIPARNTEGHITYDVVVKPKFNATTKPRPRDYRVVKHWSDRGAEQQRPASITVDLFKNGVRAETVTLNAANNWSYAWSDESGAEWTAVEQLDGLAYTVTNTREGATFIITNTLTPGETPTPTPEPTPSTTPEPTPTPTPTPKKTPLPRTGFNANSYWLSAALLGALGITMLALSAPRPQRARTAWKGAHND
ncbi:hypothetical protein DAD186_17350 [Dermabacter vaginalis]|uniref:CNA-B domain-containing protein n=1 Tax=Dermabacter vaginalis TaxID=1630135 RepID=A0A1B0ZJT9_9MICO|nr:Cna B-type domain-containing protein [Dermabacter vaginalis]ANP28285.1 hypothetical protein DAD186_17350 [Dermabacter vaginalis]